MRCTVPVYVAPALRERIETEVAERAAAGHPVSMAQVVREALADRYKEQRDA